MERRSSFPPVAAAVAGFFLVIALAGLWVAPRRDGAIDWTAPMIANGWMAWTLATATFFFVIAALLACMTLWGAYAPQAPREGVLRFATTPGDRFFISLLSAAFIHLLWLGTISTALPVASLLSVIWAVLLMRWG